MALHCGCPLDVLSWLDFTATSLLQPGTMRCHGWSGPLLLRASPPRHKCLHVQAVTTDSLLREGEAPPKVHAAILKLGLHCSSGRVSGASARCLAMLRAFSCLIQVRLEQLRWLSAGCVLCNPHLAMGRGRLGLAWPCCALHLPNRNGSRLVLQVRCVEVQGCMNMSRGHSLLRPWRMRCEVTLSGVGSICMWPGHAAHRRLPRQGVPACLTALKRDDPGCAQQCLSWPLGKGLPD